MQLTNLRRAVYPDIIFNRQVTKEIATAFQRLNLSQFLREILEILARQIQIDDVAIDHCRILWLLCDKC